MSHLKSHFTRSISVIATAAVVLSGISLFAVEAASAAPAPQIVTGNDIRPNESTYPGWHEGYNNAQRQFFVDSAGLNLAIGSKSQIINGLPGPQAVTASELGDLITGASVTTTSGLVTLQVPIFFGPNITQKFTTLRSADVITGVNTFDLNSQWITSGPINATYGANAQSTLQNLLDALATEGSIRLLAFGVQAMAPAIVPTLSWAGTEYVFQPYVAAPPTNQDVVRDRDVLGPEQDNPSLPGFNFETWHEGKSVKTSSVQADGLHFGTPFGSTTIHGTTVKTAPNDNVVTQAQLQALITGASFTVTSGSTNFQVPVNMGAGLSNFTTLLSEDFGPGTHSFSLNDTWRTSRAFGPYTAFQEVKLGDLLDTLYSVGGGQVWLAGYGVQSNTPTVVPSVVWNGTEYLFQQPVTEICQAITVAPTATNQNSQGWTFGQTRATGHNEFVSGGLRVWTESNTSTDKAAGYKAASFDLADLGLGFGVSATTNGVGAYAPSAQLMVDLNGDGLPEGYLVYEPDGYGTNNVWLSSNWTGLDISTAPTDFNGGGTGKGGSVDAWLLAFPDAKIMAVGYSMGSGYHGDWTIHSITAGCTEYRFDADTDFGTPSQVEVNDSQILPIEDVPGWGDGYGFTPRSYSTQVDGAHIGNGHATQLINTFSPALTTTGLETLITGASIDVVSGSSTFQVPVRYGSNDSFTTLRSQSLTAAGNHFSVTDRWVSSRNIVNNAGNILIAKNTLMPLADLVAAINAQGDVRVLGVAAQADSPAVVQNLVFNGTKYKFVPTEFVAATNDVRVTQPEIALDESVYVGWHQGYPNQTGANQTFAVGEAGLILTPGNDPVTPRSQILNGLATSVPGADLYSLLTSHAAISTGSGGDVTYQVAVNWTGGWGTLRSTSLSTGTHTFSLSDPWVSSKPIGSTILANTQYPLGVILDALNAQPDAVAIGFGVQSQVNSLVTDITWGNTRYVFSGAIEGSTPTITGGNTFGDTLTANAGTWAPSNVTLAYQWKANGANISGATSSTYTPTAAQVGATISVTVTGSAANYTDVSKTSLGVEILPATLTTAVPTISGSAFVGETLNADAGTWSPGITSLAYQWYADGAALTGATTSSYVLTAAEIGKTITVKVTGTLAGYTTATTTSTGLGPVTMQSVVAGAPEILGSAIVGNVLTAVPNEGTWTPATGLTFTYVWNAGGVPISGATSSTFTVTDSQIGAVITVTVTGSKTNFTAASATSGGMPAVPSPTITAVVPTITGTPEVDDTLTAVTGGSGWTPSSGLTFTYQWSADGTPIAGATGSTLLLKPAQFNKHITVTVTGAKTGYVTASATSVATAAVTYEPFFADVGQTANFFLDIQWMWTSGASTGYPQQTGLPLYKVSNAVTRQAMAAYLYRLSGDTTFVAPTDPTFADVAPTEQFYTAIEWMAANNISTGSAQPSGKPLFKPVDPVSRQAMAAFLYRFEGASDPAPSTSPFADVATDATFFKEIAWMYSSGISTGSDNGADLPLYKPTDPVSRQAMAAFLNRMVNG